MPVNGIKWVGNTSQFNAGSIKSYNGESDEGYLLEVDVQYPAMLHDFHHDLLFCLKEWKLRNLKNM